MNTAVNHAQIDEIEVQNKAVKSFIHDRGEAEQVPRVATARAKVSVRSRFLNAVSRRGELRPSKLGEHTDGPPFPGQSKTETHLTR